MTRRLGCGVGVAIFLLHGTNGAHGQSVIHVDKQATGPVHDGSGWCEAYTELSEALDAAVAGDTVLVADGTYKPDPAGLDDPRDATFELISGVRIEGGYAGCGAPDPDARDVELFETILSGDLDSNDVYVSDPCDLLTEPTRAENSYHVVTGSGTNASTILDGF